MKKIVALVLTVLLVLGFVACASEPAPPPAPPAPPAGDATPAPTPDEPVETITIRMGFNQAEVHPQFRAMEEFGRNFYEATNGRFDLQIFPNEVLGNQREMFEQVRMGTLDMVIVNNSHPGSVSDYFHAFDMPFLFADIPDALAFVNNDPVMDTVFASLEPYNIMVAAYFPAGVRSMYTSAGPIRHVDDMAGLRIRVMESPVYVRMMELFGAHGTPMAMGELFTAMQSGVVDGAENNEITYVTSRHYEVAPYWSQTNHLIVPDWLMINLDLYNSFTADERAAFHRYVLQAQAMVLELWDLEVVELMATLEGTDVVITMDVDHQSFVDAAQPLFAELTENNEAIRLVYEAIIAR